ncbi:MAG TPA: cation:proton antiporter [Nevskia sp.]|nr:cation:proton antiporter [Nevskia sp.]
MAAPAGEAHGTQLLVELFVMLGGAKLLAEIFARLRQPTVVGEILAGVLIGPQVLHLVAPSETSHVLAELGVIFLLFNVGLETKPSAIFKVGKTALIVAVLGVAVPMLCGWALMMAWDHNNIEALFTGTAMVATSVGITARVLGDMGLLDSTAARIILGAAVIDDILGLLVLAAVSSAAKGDINVAEIATTAVLSLAFVGAVTFLAAPALTRAAPHFRKLRAGNETFVVAIVLCFGLAYAAAYIGVAAIIGAFLAGMALAEAVEGNHDVHQQVRGATEFLVPFFLVNIGMQLDLGVFTNTQTLVLALVMTLLAVLSKLVGCGLGAWGLGLRGAMQVGVGMVPRGEVGIVVAQIGLAVGVVTEQLFGAVLFMACATTLIAPPLIRPLFAQKA